MAWPSWQDGQWVREPTDQEIKELLAHPDRIPQLRANLANLSWFMARRKEPIARLANLESQTKGHFYEKRFGSRELVGDRFALWFHRAVGHVDHLQPTLDRAGQRWLQEMRACRNVFT